MISTIIRSFFCFALVLITANKRKFDGNDGPALKLARTVTRTGAIPPAPDADLLATYALIPSDIIPILLEISDFSLAYPFSLVSREYFNVVCGACFRKLQGLPICPSNPTSKAILAFASQYLKTSGLMISPEGTIDTILRLITGTDNQRVIMQAITVLSQLEFPESKRKEAVYAANSIEWKLKPDEISPAHIVSYLKIKFDGFSAFSNIVNLEIWHRIRCTRDDKFCRPEHVNRSKKIFFGNIRMFYPEFFVKKYEEIYIMDSLPLMKECNVKFLPFYQEIMGGLIMASPVLSLDSIFEKIKADDCDLFWKMCLMQLSALPKWHEVTRLSSIVHDPILTTHFEKIIEVLSAFFTPAGFSLKDLSESKKSYVGTSIFAFMNLRNDATDEKVKLIATKTVTARDFETSGHLLAMLRAASHYSAIFDAIDAAMIAFSHQSCALDFVKNLHGRVLTDYVADRRENRKSPQLLLGVSFNLDQIVHGDVLMAERYNAVLEYVAGQSLFSVRKMAYVIVYTAASVTSLGTKENFPIIVEALSKKGSWVQEAYDFFNSKRN